MLKNTKIITRLLVGFGLVLFLLVGVGGGGIWSMIMMSRGIEDIKKGFKTVEDSQRLRANINQMRRYEKDILLNMESPEKVLKYRKQYDEVIERYGKRFEELSSLATEPQEKELTAAIKTNFTTYLNGFNGVYEQIRLGKLTNKDEANQQMEAFKEASHNTEDLVLKLADFNSKEVTQELQSGDVARKTMVTVIAALLFTAICAAVFICFAISRSIIVPVNRLAEQAHFAGVAHVALGERVALVQRRPVAHIKE